MVLIASAVLWGLAAVVVAYAYAYADGAGAASRPPVVVAGPDAAHPATGASLPSPARVVTQLRDARVSDAALSGTSPVALLGALPELGVPELCRLAGANPATVRELSRRPPAVLGIAAWWSALAPDERGALAEGMPELVGNLEGIPFDARDEANRRFLDQRGAARSRCTAATCACSPRCGRRSSPCRAAPRAPSSRSTPCGPAVRVS